MQCEISFLKLPTDEQSHPPLAFLGSEFDKTQKNWSTFEKERYAILQACEKMDYMLICEEDIHLFTNHRNLHFVFDSLSVKSTNARHVVNKVQRWALYLSRFQYTIEYIEGERNNTADMMTRWYKGYRGNNNESCRNTSFPMQKGLIASPIDKYFVWPSFELLKKSHKYAQIPEECTVNEEGLARLDSKIWIPDVNLDFQLKLLVVAKCSIVGQRGLDSIWSMFKEQFVWKEVQNDTEEFVNN